MALAAPVIRAEAPGLRLLDFAWSREDSDRLKELWPESSGLMRFQFWTLLVYTFDAMLVAWLCQGKPVGQYLLVADLFSKLRLLLQSACLLYPSDAADESRGVDLWGRLTTTPITITQHIAEHNNYRTLIDKERN